jgi:hypothetical protein
MDIRGKQVSIVIIDDIALRQQLKSAIDSMNEQFAVEMEDRDNFFEFHNFYQPIKEVFLKQPVEHGSYLQFRKRDKRKNFR